MFGLIHTGRAPQRKQTGPVDVNGSIHTARKQHQRICLRVASRVLCEWGLWWSEPVTKMCRLSPPIRSARPGHVMVLGNLPVSSLGRCETQSQPDLIAASQTRASTFNLRHFLELVSWVRNPTQWMREHTRLITVRSEPPNQHANVFKFMQILNIILNTSWEENFFLQEASKYFGKHLLWWVSCLFLAFCISLILADGCWSGSRLANYRNIARPPTVVPLLRPSCCLWWCLLEEISRNTELSIRGGGWQVTGHRGPTQIYKHIRTIGLPIGFNLLQKSSLGWESTSVRLSNANPSTKSPNHEQRDAQLVSIPATSLHWNTTGKGLRQKTKGFVKNVFAESLNFRPHLHYLCANKGFLQKKNSAAKKSEKCPQ